MKFVKNKSHNEDLKLRLEKVLELSQGKTLEELAKALPHGKTGVPGVSYKVAKRLRRRAKFYQRYGVV